LPRFEGFFRS